VGGVMICGMFLAFAFRFLILAVVWLLAFRFFLSVVSLAP